MRVIGPQSNKEAGSPAPGGTVNLILSLSNPGDGLVQVLDQPTQAVESVDETAEPVHRVRDLLPVPTDAVVQLHHMTFILWGTRLPVLCPSHSPSFLSLSQHAVPQSPAYKTFWRRCQGLLENTLGSLMRKKNIYQQSASEVKGIL